MTTQSFFTTPTQQSFCVTQLDQLSEELRVEQPRLTKMLSFANSLGDHIIMCGDFNAFHRSDCIE